MFSKIYPKQTDLTSIFVITPALLCKHVIFNIIIECKSVAA